MKAIAFTHPLPIEAQDSLVELELPRPEFGPRDLLVNLRAVSVNPVDTKVRGARHQGSASENTGKPRVLGWDATGVVVGTSLSSLGGTIGGIFLEPRRIYRIVNGLPYDVSPSLPRTCFLPS
jgi:hypothetical protein